MPFSLLQDDIHAGGDVVGDERGHADAEVDVEAVLQLAGDAADDEVALASGGSLSVAHGALPVRGRVRRSMRFSQGAREDALHVDAGGVDEVGVELAGFDELFDFGDGDACRRWPSWG